MVWARATLAAVRRANEELAGLGLGVTVSVLGYWATRPILLRLLRHAEASRRKSRSQKRSGRRRQAPTATCCAAARSQRGLKEVRIIQ